MWDSSASRWMLWDDENQSIRTLAGATLGTWNSATLGVDLSSFAYRSADNTIFYCDTADHRLYKRTGGAPTSVALAWDVNSISCQGTRLEYSSGSDSLFLIYKQGKMYGIAEYLNP